MDKAEEDNPYLGNSCPNCGIKLAKPKGLTLSKERAKENKNKPKPGDWAVCHKCYSVLAFSKDLKLEWPDPLKDIPEEVDLLRTKMMEIMEEQRKREKATK